MRHNYPPKTDSRYTPLGRSSKDSYANYRVIQRDLVYVIGIPVDLAKEEILQKYEYFGQYGQIKKIAVNAQTLHQTTYQKTPTVSAYVTFIRAEDALECVYALEGFSINGHPLKASFGTSKYCTSFLAGQKCIKPDCMYLHHTGKPEDSFTTEEITAGSLTFTSMTRPAKPPDYNKYPLQDRRPTVFPPRRLLQEEAKPTREGQMVPPQSDNSFICRLLGQSPFMLNRLVVDYTTTESLNEQLDLGVPSMRVFIETVK